MLNEEIEILAAIENVENNEDAVEIPRRVHMHLDGFNMRDKNFIKSYRLNKELARELIGVVGPYLTQRQRTHGLTNEEKVLIALNLFASGSYQHSVANNTYFDVSQSSISRCVNEVTEALNYQEVFTRYVKFPRTINELNSLRTRFYRKYGMPGIIGCIDCTHVAIVPPNANDPNYPEYAYVNRKNYHSINVQLVCTEELEILHVNARFPGAAHDSHIWNNSNIETVLRNIYERGNQGYYLLGDSGYPLRPWLLTPVANPQAEEEITYNDFHKRARSTIERCNGLLKMRFKCLLKHRVLHYSPNKASKIINACIVLHNMCVIHNIDLEEDNIDLENDINENIFHNDPRVNPFLLERRRMQRTVINYFR